MSRSLRAHLLLLGVAMLWGATFVLVKAALRDSSPLLFNLVRMVVAFLCMAALYWRHFGRLNARAVWSGATVGLFLAAGYQFQTAGLARTTPSKSAFITGLVVVLVPLLAAIPGFRARGARPRRWNVWVAALLASAGILLLTMPPPAGPGIQPTVDRGRPTMLQTVSFTGLQTGSFYGLKRFSISPRSIRSSPFSPSPINLNPLNLSRIHLTSINLGDLLTLACAIAFAFHCIALARTSERVPFEQLALLQIGFAAFFMAVSTPLLEHPWLHLSARLLVAIAITGVLGTAAAFSIQSWAQQFLPATHTILILSLEPVFAALASFVFLGERLGTRAALGAVLVLSAIGLTEMLPSPVYPTAHEGITT